jgi:hypothetical protein
MPYNNNLLHTKACRILATHGRSRDKECTDTPLATVSINHKIDLQRHSIRKPGIRERVLVLSCKPLSQQGSPTQPRCRRTQAGSGTAKCAEPRRLGSQSTNASSHTHTPMTHKALSNKISFLYTRFFCSHTHSSSQMS